MIDYSFLRLEQSLEEAKNIGNPKVATEIVNDQVHLIPNETYCQVTNTDFGITLAGDYVVYLVDCCDNILLDITDTFTMRDNIHSELTGLNQIIFEFYIKEDFGEKELFLRIDHTQSNAKYYSSPFVCTELYKEETTYFTYRSYGVFFGISYDKHEKYQTIRLKTFFDSVSSETESSEYYQITSKNTVSPRAKYKQLERYVCEYMNRFVFERANVMLIHDVVYADGVRITNKPQFESEERLGNSNLFVASVECYKDYNDTIGKEHQLFEPLQLVSFQPTGVWLNSFPPTLLNMVFNRPVINEGVTVTIKKQDGTTILELSGSDLVFTDNQINSSIFGLSPNTRYYVLVSQGITDGFIEFSGIYDENYWTFRLSEADYDATDYNNSDYLAQ